MVVVIVGLVVGVGVVGWVGCIVIIEVEVEIVGIGELVVGVVIVDVWVDFYCYCFGGVVGYVFWCVG